MRNAIAVIVPAYREARLIGRMLRRVPPAVAAIYVVDDASPDATAATAEAVDDPRIRVLRHRENRGVGAAIATGYRAALKDGHDVLVVMAGDDQMDPADLPALVAPVLAGRAAYAKGNRLRHPSRGAMPPGRRLAGRWLAALTGLAAGVPVGDSQCGYTALTAATARDLPLHDLWPRYGYPNDLIVMLAARGKPIAEVPVRAVYGDETSGLRPWHFLVVCAVIGRAAWRHRGAAGAPIRVAGGPAR